MTRLFLGALFSVLVSVSGANAQYWHHGGWGHGGWGGGGGFAGGVIGGVVGGVFGGVIARPQPQYVPDASVQWCMNRFRSYNPQTGFYVGLDNQLHSCP